MIILKVIHHLMTLNALYILDIYCKNEYLLSVFDLMMALKVLRLKMFGVWMITNEYLQKNMKQKWIIFYINSFFFFYISTFFVYQSLIYIQYHHVGVSNQRIWRSLKDIMPLLIVIRMPIRNRLLHGHGLKV